ncbi:MAG: DNA methyltransferase [Anaerolineae bacterium]
MTTAVTTSAQQQAPTDDGTEYGRLPIDADFDAAFADELARLETYNRHLYRPNTYLHKWWARRCGTTFRLILKQLVQDDGRRDYYAPGGLEGKLVLDPMAGGGTTLHEAIRLGANVIGADIDPIPILQARATLSEVPLPRMEEAFAQFHSALREALLPFYQTTCPECSSAAEVRFVLYGLRRRCRCREALFVDSHVLRQNSDGTAVRIAPDGSLAHEQTPRDAAGTEPRLIMTRKSKQCPHCEHEYEDDLAEPYYRRYAPVAVAGACPQHTLFFAVPGPSELAALGQADRLREGLFDAVNFPIAPGPKSNSLIARGVRCYLDLFSSRQLLYLWHAAQALAQFEPLVRLNLALLVSASLEFNSMLCGYKGIKKRRSGAIRHTFSHHAYSFPYTALENNPIYDARTSGTLRNLFHGRIVRGRIWAANPVERRIEGGKTVKVTVPGEVDGGVEANDFHELQHGRRRFLLIQGSSVRLGIPDHSVDFVVTDPPYFDSVQYSDLAAFFRVWLRKLLPAGAIQEYELVESAVDQQANGDGQYTQVISGIFAECHRVLKKRDGRLIFTYHHWNPKGWAALTLALKKAGFMLVNRYVVHAENLVSVHIANQNALLHDVILVLAPAESGVHTHWERPTAIDGRSSERFIRDCGTAVGWLLNSSVPDGEIEEIWQDLLAQGWRSVNGRQ